MTSPKMMREALCLAQSALADRARAGMDEARAVRSIGHVGALIAEIDKHRPLGLDGKHRDLHTPTCGCGGRGGPWTITIDPSGTPCSSERTPA